MRLVALVLTLGCLTAGCVVQAGDPSAEETQRPDEIVAVSNNTGVVTSTKGTAPSPTPEPSTHSNTTTTTPNSGSSLPSNNAQPMGGTLTLQAENPNPQPWDGHSSN
jgi:hypothetical protein